MNSRLVFRPQAEGELHEAHDWYEAQKPALGEAFLSAVDLVLERVGEQPLAYSCVHGDIRRATVHRFPYGVFFRVLEKEIVILGILHGRRHPKSWQFRSWIHPVEDTTKVDSLSRNPQLG